MVYLKDSINAKSDDEESNFRQRQQLGQVATILTLPVLVSLQSSTGPHLSCMASEVSGPCAGDVADA